MLTSKKKKKILKKILRKKRAKKAKTQKCAEITAKGRVKTK